MRLVKVLQPPFDIPDDIDLFLAGSIEMDTAPKWQDAVIEGLDDLPLTIANPRRDDWDTTWTQSINSEPFRTQVLWELQALENARRIALYLAPDTKSPISLLELGLHLRSGKLLVCCPHGFWRRGNVEIVTWKYNVPFYEDLDSFIRALRILVGLEALARKEKQ